MELRHLRYFVAVAEAGNLSRAAHKLFIAQPPLSLQIKQFEDAMGVALFTRHPKGMRLTLAGEQLLPQARDLLARAAGLREVARAKGDGGQGAGGTLTMGYVPSASSTVLPELVRALRRERPAVVLHLHEMISEEQQDALVAGRIDAGIARILPRNTRLVAACHMADPFCLALPRQQSSRQRSSSTASTLNLRDFAAHPFIGFTRHRGPAYFDRAMYLCGQAGFSPSIRYEASTVHGVMDLVSTGLGVALVPASASLLKTKNVAVHRLRRSGSGDVLALLRRKADPNSLLPVIEAAVAKVLVTIEERVLQGS
jgi:DNA-binding transcriptional LysR family regulator